MTAEEQYFVSLISSFLNSCEPEIPQNINWNEIYRLSEIHNVSAIIANQISKLKEEYRPEKKLYSAFRQQMGYTLMSYDEKTAAYNILKKILSDNNIDFVFIKGIVLKNLYPVKEFRTSSDIDVIIRDESVSRLKSIISSNGYNVTGEAGICLFFKMGNILIEAHSNLDSDNRYFENIFELAEHNGNEYYLNLEKHLLYVLCHMAKHFNICGAGIRMFMDIDVIIRSPDFRVDYNQFFTLCKELGIENFVKFTFSLCSHWFSTPVITDSDINNNSTIKNMFENEILSGGSFGFEKRGLSDYYISQGIGKDGKNNFLSKLKAIWLLFFPKKKYLYESFPYARKHHFLLPVAWFERLFKAVFLRNAHSVQTIEGIVNSDKEAAEYKKLLNELNI